MNTLKCSSLCYIVYSFSDAWLSTGVGDTIDDTDGAGQDHGDIYCVVCFDNGNLEIFDVPNFNCDNWSGKFYVQKEPCCSCSEDIQL